MKDQPASSLELMAFLMFQILVLSSENFENLEEEHDYINVQSNCPQDVVVDFQGACSLMLSSDNQLSVINQVDAEQKNAEYADDEVEDSTNVRRKSAGYYLTWMKIPIRPAASSTIDPTKSKPPIIVKSVEVVIAYIVKPTTIAQVSKAATKTEFFV